MNRSENINYDSFRGSHAPLDTDAHWTWRNPLNIIPSVVLAVFALGLLPLVFALF